MLFIYFDERILHFGIIIIYSQNVFIKQTNKRLFKDYLDVMSYYIRYTYLYNTKNKIIFTLF